MEQRLPVNRYSGVSYFCNPLQKDNPTLMFNRVTDMDAYYMSIGKSVSNYPLERVNEVML